MSKTKIKIGLREGLNASIKELMAYHDPTKNEWTWVDENNKIHSRKEPYSSRERIQLMNLDQTNRFFEVEIDENNDISSRKESLRALINWLKRWPKIAHAVSADSFNSFPTDVHKLFWANQYRNDKSGKLSINEQPFVLFDETEVKKAKSEGLSRKRKTLVLLETIKNGVENGVNLIDQVMFMCGLNPIELDIDEKEQHLHDWIESNNKHEEFAEICEKKTYSDPALFAVNAAVSLFIISKSDSGYYQFEGSPISKDIQEVALYFRTNKDKWTILKNELRGKGVSSVPDTPEYVGKKKVAETKLTPSAQKESTSEFSV